MGNIYLLRLSDWSLVERTCQAEKNENGPFRDNCYAVPPRSLRFQDADYYCRITYGGRLASIIDAEELEFVRQTIKDYGSVIVLIEY